MWRTFILIAESDPNAEVKDAELHQAVYNVENCLKKFY